MSIRKWAVSMKYGWTSIDTPVAFRFTRRGARRAARRLSESPTKDPLASYKVVGR